MERELADGSTGAGTRRRREVGFLLLLALAALALRAVRLGFQPLWWDEGYSVWFATHPLAQMAALTAEDIHPPLYYALLRGWTALLGTGPVALRLLSVLLGVGAVPAVYLAGRRMLGTRTARLAALLLAANPLHVFYSQEVRMYGLVALLSTGALAAAWSVFDQGPRTEDASARPCPPSFVLRLSSYVAYVLLTTAALYTQYYAIFLPLGLTLYAVWRWRRATRPLALWLAAQAVVALLYLPWVLYAAPRLIPYVSQKVAADADRPLGLLAYFGRHLSAFLAGHTEGPLAPYWPIPLLLLAPLAVGWWLWRKQEAGMGKREKGRGMLLVTLVTALAAGWLVGLRYPFFPERGERLLLLALPAFVLLAAAGIHALWQRLRLLGYVTLAGVLASSAAGLAAFYAVPRYAGDDYRPLIAQVAQQGLPEDAVFCVYPWQVGYWRSYAPASGPAPVLSPSPAWDAEVAAALDAALAQGRVWFPAHLALGGVLESRVEAHLAGRAVPFVHAWYGPGTRLSAWAATMDVDATMQAPEGGLPIRFSAAGADAAALVAVGRSTGPAAAANTVVPVTLAWQDGAARQDLAVSVRLVDDLEQIWAQHDYEPLGGLNLAAAPRAEDRLGLLIPAGTPPGRYHLQLVVRSAGSDLPLQASAADGTPLGASPRLAVVEVGPAGRDLGPEQLPIAARQTVELEDGLRFLGHSMAGGPLAPGGSAKVSLFWQATAAPSRAYVAFVQVLGRDGAPLALWEAPPGAAYPTSAWDAGTVMRTQAVLRLPATAADGRYRLIAGLFRPEDGARLRTASGADHITLGRVTVRGRGHVWAPPAPAHPADAAFGDVARLLGYDLAAPEDGFGRGVSIPITLHWQALAATERPYTVFVHLLDEEGAIRGYGDSEPGRGALPTTGWQAGEYLADEHTVQVEAGAGPGVYRIAVGLYDPATGERLATPDGRDQVLLQEAVVIR